MKSYFANSAGTDSLVIIKDIVNETFKGLLLKRALLRHSKTAIFLSQSSSISDRQQKI